MKTEYRPIAMRCTRKQFDSIKDRINLPIVDISSFEKYPYLMIDWLGEKKVSNSDDVDFAYRTVYKTFDAELFLDCCGRDKEDIWKAEEMEYRVNKNGVWNRCGLIGEFRLKPQPNYQKEIEALQQKAKENGMKVIVNFEKL